ncbi:MAG: hypothetical protein E2O39_01200 [Planctomycetota bacterium]|nr:MAG: hypothetical protein E2O39_01200 [Planctomycetota bacterium]
MAKRSDNMLEAFKSSTAPARERAGKPPKSSGGAGGPFAQPAPPPSSGGPAWLSLAANPGGIAMLVGSVLLLAMAFLLGRLSAPSVQASAPAEVSDGGFQFPILPEAPVAKGGTTSQEPATELVEGETEADRAFLDPANLYSIRVLEYGRTERDQALAFAAYDHLRGNGFPVVWPRHKGNSLFLFVGAAPKIADLEGLLEQLRRTPGPGRDVKAYEGAFRVNIGDYL